MSRATARARGCECGGGDEDALGCAELARAPLKRLDFGAPDVVTLGVALRLEVYTVDPERVLPDDPVDTLVAGRCVGLRLSSRSVP